MISNYTNMSFNEKIKLAVTHAKDAGEFDADRRLPIDVEREKNAVLNSLVLYSGSDFAFYEKKANAYCDAVGIPRVHRDLLQVRYETFVKKYALEEMVITDCASQMVQVGLKNPTDKDYARENGDINVIGANIANGPNLTLLDGGPGAGKSFSLGKSLKAMGCSVVCLGATNSAGAGLFDSMKEEIGDKDGSRVFGGISVREFNYPNTPELKEKKAELIELFSKDPKPCLMVDEAGLLDHSQMTDLMVFAQKMGIKTILAGDSQQIPPERGQPFKMLAESLKDTPAYVNAPYVFRQKDFLDKAITSGIYHGNCDNKDAIDVEVAGEFMTAAYDLGDPKVKLENGDKYSLKNRVSEFIQEKGITKSDVPSDEFGEPIMSLEYFATRQYIKELSLNLDTLLPNGSKDVLNKGISKDNYDAYLAAALCLQHRGIQGYELRGNFTQTNSNDEGIFEEVSLRFAKDYAKTLETAGENPEFSDGILAITTTKLEAYQLNSSIRKAMNFEGDLKEGEPIIVNGNRRLATKEDLNLSEKEFDFAYALDVTTTQGLTQKGPVLMVVRNSTQDMMQGGEILVGATRHKSNFEVIMSSDVNKEEFFEASKKQNAAGRLIDDAFREHLHTAAGGNKKNIREKDDKAIAAKELADKNRLEDFNKKIQQVKKARIGR